MSEIMYKVNLLPPKLQREDLVDVRRLLLVAGTITVGAVLLGSLAYFLVTYINMRNQVEDAKKQVATLQPTVAYVENLRKERATMEATVGDYKALLNRQITWSSLLYELNDIAPVDVWLVELNMIKTELPAGAAAGKAPAPAPAPESAAKGERAQAEPASIPRPNTITIKGFSRSVPAIGVFVKNLKQLPYFKDAIIKNINSTADGNSFELTAYIKDEIRG